MQLFVGKRRAVAALPLASGAHVHFFASALEHPFSKAESGQVTSSIQFGLIHSYELLLCMHAELGIYVARVVVHSTSGNVELLLDARRRIALGKKREHVFFAR